MKAMRRSPFVRRVVIPLTLAAFLSACYKWSNVDTSPSQIGQTVNVDQPDKVRVTWHRQEYEVREPTIQADSLIGQDQDGNRIAIPIAEIQRIETRESGPWGTVGLTVGVIAVVALAALGAMAIACANEGCGLGG